MASGKNSRSTNQVALPLASQSEGQPPRAARRPSPGLGPGACAGGPLLQRIPPPPHQVLAQRLALFLPPLTAPFSFYFWSNFFPLKTHFSGKVSAVVPDLETHASEIRSDWGLLSWKGFYRLKASGHPDSNRSYILLHHKNETPGHWASKDTVASRAGTKSWEKISEGGQQTCL